MAEVDIKLFWRKYVTYDKRFGSETWMLKCRLAEKWVCLEPPFQVNPLPSVGRVELEGFVGRNYLSHKFQRVDGRLLNYPTMTQSDCGETAEYKS